MHIARTKTGYSKNKIIRLIPVVFFVSLLANFSSWAELSLTNESTEEEKTSDDNYIAPFLITRTQKTFNLSAKDLESRVIYKLKRGQLNVRGRFGSEGLSPEAFKQENYFLPQEVLQGSQLEAIQNCQLEKCLMKLSSAEVAQLAKSTNKKETYRQQIFQRIINYLKKLELKGYEDRPSNTQQIKMMWDLFPSLAQTPNSSKFLKKSLFELSSGVGKPINSWVRQEMVNIAPDQMQPILRVSENYEFVERGRRLFVELHIYTNHYFDSSVTLYEVVSDKSKPKEAQLVITDIMEIDELKKSVFIRTMFKGKMVKAVTKYQSDFLDSLIESH